MTEENKENCNFQQNYNVFGLDDKPCCYLYHKYCDEIDSCYFKRCKRLEQENKELKEEKQAIKSYLGIEAKTILERLEELDEWKHNDKLLLWKYRSALEEIREIVNEPCIEDEDCETCDSNCMCKEILDKINEVLQCE